ncbi:MAG: hypothetical protein GF416_09200 [Candidatus Altiarchaeales archaeon]|nr:hypothetical protein [Candidatus Altiarchaeales archaeon]MBD3417295.1 hypothetical protein [Candidatus Altiarchaeales archaeon]
MESTGLCDICGKAGAMYTCSLCGKRVCQLCVTVGGVCKYCVGGKSISEDEKIVRERVLKEKGLDPRI